MEYSDGWTPVRVDETWAEERFLMESELELQIWRWALLEAHLWEASQVYESLMGSPFAPRTQGNLMHPGLEGWHLTEGGSAVDTHRRHSGLPGEAPKEEDSPAPTAQVPTSTSEPWYGAVPGVRGGGRPGRGAERERGEKGY